MYRQINFYTFQNLNSQNFFFFEKLGYPQPFFHLKGIFIIRFLIIARALILKKCTKSRFLYSKSALNPSFHTQKVHYSYPQVPLKYSKSALNTYFYPQLTSKYSKSALNKYFYPQFPQNLSTIDLKILRKCTKHTKEERLCH